MAETVPNIDEDEILQYVSQEGPVPSAAIAKEFDLPLQDIADLLLQLERDQSIRSKKPDGTVLWLEAESSDDPSDIDDVEMLSEESIEYLTTGDTDKIPESYQLQQLLEEVEYRPLDTLITEIAGDGDLELLSRLFDNGFEEEWSRNRMEELSVNDVVERILDLQQHVYSPVDSLYRMSSLPSGDELRTIRKRLGLTQSEVAENTSVNQAQLSNYENNDEGISSERLQGVVEFYRDRYEENESGFQSEIIS